jgi:LysM repeat protein
VADLPPGKAPKGKKGKKAGPLGGKKGLLIGGGALAVVAVFALIKRGSGTGTAATGTTAATTGTPTYDSTNGDQYNQLANQLAGLQTQIANITAGQSSGSNPTVPPVSVTPTPTPPPANPGVKRPVQPPPKPKTSILQTVLVKRGQTLSGIAASHHETLATLERDNPVYLTNKKYRGGNLIFAGDKVKVR